MLVLFGLFFMLFDYYFELLAGWVCLTFGFCFVGVYWFPRLGLLFRVFDFGFVVSLR